ncbi:MAG TPA: type 4a pilus biogenesis protein PilO [Candidatus Saccharimonadales bacterium]
MESKRITGLKKRQAISSANRTMFAWVAIASIAISILLVAAQFLYKQFLYNNNVYSAKSKAATTLATNQENIVKLKEAFGPLDAGTDKNVSSTKVLNALPREKDTSAFGTSIQQIIAPLSGVTLESVSIESQSESAEAVADGSTGGGPQPINASVTVSGSYEQILAFVRDLERVIRPITINTMNVTGSDTNTRLALELTTYWQPAKGVEIKKEVVKS